MILVDARPLQTVAGVRPDIDFLPFQDVVASVKEDVGMIRTCPYLPPGYEVVGFVYDVTTGLLRLVEA